MTHTRNQQHGFTLIELLIAVAVVGILAAIAYPSYTEQIARGRRVEAQATLMAASQWMERFYSENYRYDQNSAGTLVTEATQFPARFSTSPPPGQGSAVYDITVVTPSRSEFTITATRKTGTSMASDKCGNFTVDHFGRKSIATGTWDTAKVGSAKSTAIQACWK